MPTRKKKPKKRIQNLVKRFTQRLKKARGLSGCNKYPENYKTELCRNWLIYKKCKYGDRCQFAHGEDDLIQSRYKPVRRISAPPPPPPPGVPDPYRFPLNPTEDDIKQIDAILQKIVSDKPNIRNAGKRKKTRSKRRKKR